MALSALASMTAPSSSSSSTYREVAQWIVTVMTEQATQPEQNIIFVRLLEVWCVILLLVVAFIDPGGDSCLSISLPPPSLLPPHSFTLPIYCNSK